MAAGDVRERELPGDPPRVLLQLPYRGDSPRVARREMARLESGLDHRALARVRVIVTEMVSNCVWDSSDGVVLVEVVAGPDVIRGEVSELDSEGEPRPPNPVAFRRGGFGRIMVRRLADRTGPLEGRLGTWFEIDRPAAA